MHRVDDKGFGSAASIRQPTTAETQTTAMLGARAGEDIA